MKFEKLGITVYILALVLGCGVSNYDRGVSFLGKKEFDTAVPYFEAAIDSGINTADAHRELGITCYKKDMLQQAANHLRIACIHCCDWLIWFDMIVTDVFLYDI